MCTLHKAAPKLLVVCQEMYQMFLDRTDDHVWTIEEMEHFAAKVKATIEDAEKEVA